jgi:hypothetical protein
VVVIFFCIFIIFLIKIPFQCIILLFFKKNWPRYFWKKLKKIPKGPYSKSIFSKQQKSTSHGFEGKSSISLSSFKNIKKNLSSWEIPNLDRFDVDYTMYISDKIDEFPWCGELPRVPEVIFPRAELARGSLLPNYPTKKKNIQKFKR